MYLDLRANFTSRVNFTSHSTYSGGLCKSWTLDSGLDYRLDYGLSLGLSRLMLPDVTVCK